MNDDTEIPDNALDHPVGPPPPVTNIKVMVRSAYDLQKLRVQMGNRIVANFKAKLGQPPSVSEEDSLDDDGKQVLDDLRTEYKKITDGVKTFPRQANFKGTEIISTYTELCLIAQYMTMEQQEDTAFRRLGSILREYPIFTEFLDKVKGIGPAMAGVIISEFNIHRAKYPSSMWAYAGLDVAADGRGRSRKAEHLVVRQYTDREGKPAERNGITFNPFLKTKLIGVLATSFLRVGDNPYRDIYLGYKNRLENHPKWGTAEVSKGHRHNASMRYMIKRFLVDLYKVWRAIEGLAVAPEYSEGKLGIRHSA